MDAVLSSDPSRLYVDGRASESRRAVLPVFIGAISTEKAEGHEQRGAVPGLADAIVRRDGHAPETKTSARQPHGRGLPPVPALMQAFRLT